MAGDFDRRRLGALMVKEFRQISRDPSTFLVAFALPMLLLFLFGYAVSLDMTDVRVALVVEDSSAEATSLGLDFANSPYFSVTSTRSMASARDALLLGRQRGIIVIPQGFGASARRGDSPTIQVVTDGSQPNVAQFVANYAQGVHSNWAISQGLMTPPPVTVSPRFWFNPSLASRNIMVPGSIAIVMTMIGTLLTALVVAREWERGTMEAMMATPMRMTEFIAAKLIPYYLLAMCSLALCTLLAVTVFGVPFRGSVAALLIMSTAFLVPMLGLGLFISAATKSQFVASQAALFSSFLPSFLLSGFIYEISSMPAPIQAVTYIVPARYFIEPLRTIFLVGDNWSLFLPDLLAMLLMGAGYFFLAFRVTRRSLD